MSENVLKVLFASNLKWNCIAQSKRPARRARLPCGMTDFAALLCIPAFSPVASFWTFSLTKIERVGFKSSRLGFWTCSTRAFNQCITRLISKLWHRPHCRKRMWHFWENKTFLKTEFLKKLNFLGNLKFWKTSNYQKNYMKQFFKIRRSCKTSE